MKYMGSKNRIAKHILPIILKNRKENQYYVEPFVGGANMIDKVNALRIGADINPYLIELFKGLQKGRALIFDIPKTIYDKARTEYNNKTTNEFDLFTIAWIGYMASANGRFFEGGYSGISNTKIGTSRNYINESISNIQKQVSRIQNIHFVCSSYENLDIPKNSIIYCDIPYKNSKQYSFSKDFDYDKFWNWAREKANQGHKVFISEYNAPDDFECVWSKEVTNAMSTKKTYKPTEKLFKFNVI